MGSNRRNLFWTLAHIGLGFLCTITPFALIVWFYFIFIANIGKSIKQLSIKRPALFIMLFTYLISFEVLDRMAKTSPFIPYELSKYLLIVMGLIGLGYSGLKSTKGIWLFVLMLPSIFYSLSGERNTGDILSNLLGPLSLGLVFAFSEDLNVRTGMFLSRLLKLIWLPCVATLAYTIIKTPDFDNIVFSLKAQFDTTAGFSSNQVSTILGLGFFLGVLSLFNVWKFAGNRFLDILLVTGFLFQGLLSFSRGGIVVAVFCVVLGVFLIGNNKTNTSRLALNKGTLIILVLILTPVVYGVFRYANKLTDGNLLLRYSGETNGTLAGSKEKSLNTLTTGRVVIMNGDFRLWVQNPLLGAGVGDSRYSRDVARGHPPHVEISRLLGEHGVFGLVYIIIIFNTGLKLWKQRNQKINSGIVVLLFTFAILTTFHAAMRTFTTPLLLAVAVLKYE